MASVECKTPLHGSPLVKYLAKLTGSQFEVKKRRVAIGDFYGKTWFEFKSAGSGGWRFGASSFMGLGFLPFAIN